MSIPKWTKEEKDNLEKLNGKMSHVKDLSEAVISVGGRKAVKGEQGKIARAIYANNNLPNEKAKLAEWKKQTGLGKSAFHRLRLR